MRHTVRVGRPAAATSSKGRATYAKGELGTAELAALPLLIPGFRARLGRFVATLRRGQRERGVSPSPPPGRYIEI